jgi:hypothetical protein
MLTDGLAACWELDELSGTRFDHIGNYNLTQVGGVLGVPDDQDTIAAQFVAASHQYLYNHSVLSNLFHQPFTLAFWVTPTTLALSGLITNGNSHNAGQYDWRILILDGAGHLDVAWGGGGMGVISPSTAHLTAGVRNLVIVWHDGVTLRLQVNNGAIESNTGNPLTGTATLSRINVGAIGDGLQDWLSGLMNKILFFTRVLSADERALIWNDGEGF